MKIKMNKFRKSNDYDSINRIMSNISEDTCKEVNSYFREMLRNSYKEVSENTLQYKRCGLCKQVFSDRPFENMSADGESLLIKIELFGEEMILCKKCSSKLYQWLNQ